jgi:hypothetical protein
MAVSMEEFARELRAFSERGAVVNELRKDLRKPLPKLRSEVRAHAVRILPHRGGLGAWVAAARFSVRFKDAGRSAGVSIRVGRKSGKNKSDLDSLDRTGTVRHPLYGNRSEWFGQKVPPGFFTEMWDKQQWLKIADDAFDRALDKIRNG